MAQIATEQNGAAYKLNKLINMGPEEYQGLIQQAVQHGAPPPMDTGIAGPPGMMAGDAYSNIVNPPPATPPPGGTYTGNLKPEQLAALAGGMQPKAPAPYQWAPQVSVGQQAASPRTAQPMTLGRILGG